jgi:predicted helicase
MTESDRLSLIQRYLDEVQEQFESGHAIEHAYRPALKALMSGFEDMVAVNDPKHSEHGAPDFIFLKKSNPKIVKGHAEAKDIGKDLDKEERSEQMTRYAGYANLFLTDYLEFRFFRNGEKYETISLGRVENGQLHLTPEHSERLTRELGAFLDHVPERIKSGKRLAQIMGGKARRIRDNVEAYLTDDSIQSEQFDSIYELMKRSLVHDLSTQKFADMYAQTLVYGLFVARYSDTTPDDFTRSEARDLVPHSNPFLRKFFDHIAGADFDTRLTYIVDELCEVFSVSDVADIVHKHLRIQDSSSDAKDPIIHFYEDFLKEYDPELRKQMGAYYTPVPVVHYIVQQVDRILKENFGISKGLASTETITQTVDTQPWRKKGERKDRTTKEVTLPRVQILDPAVGTATFLNEMIKFIYKGFKGQEGQWPSYVNNNLLERIHGFELMMAPYTIAHLKLGMTLRELGVKDLSKRLGVYLTNTLEPGDEVKVDIFSALGLAGAVSEESRLAAIVKNETPVMVVIGNPPYSGVSSNETPYANSLIEKYKIEPGGKQKLQERKHWLNDDYVKFIAFAEDMISKNGSGIVAMITNNGYLDNPTFRGMRWQLAKTFDKIYVLDLHGNTTKKETAPDGNKDANVFDIKQGVGIILAVKNGKKSGEYAGIYHSDIYGKRQYKFDALNGDIGYKQIELTAPGYYFVPQNVDGREEYELGVSVERLFIKGSSGVQTSRDLFVVDVNRHVLERRISEFFNLDIVDEDIRNKYFRQGSPKYARGDTRGWKIASVRRKANKPNIVGFGYRPFDNRYIDYREDLIDWPRTEVLKNMERNNLSIVIGRQGQAVGTMPWNVVFAEDIISDLNLFYRGGGMVYPLFIYHKDGTHTPNFDQTELKKFSVNLVGEPIPEDVFDYIYAILHSPAYREKYKEFLKSDFPRIPVPTQQDFKYLVRLGHELRELHLMKSPIMDIGDTTYPEVGSNVVEKLSYSDHKVWINDRQYFGNVPERAWNFYVGGYQPAQKWLKDRKGRELTHEDITHYQRIINILLETDRIMLAIDEK